MTAVGIAVRWLHLASCVALVGACAMLLLAGRSDRPTARRWEARVLAWSRAAVLVAFGTGVLALGYQTAVLEGRAAAALEPSSLLRVALETRGGAVWLVRQSLLLLLAAFLAARADVERRADWQAARGESAGLALAALAPLAASGHAAAVEPATAAIAVDLAHLLAAGLWIGALLPLAALLRAACAEAGADARPYAVLAARRFSRLAFSAMLALVATGVLNALNHVANVAGLIGTAYGRWLLVKVGLLVPLSAIAWVNRRRLIPALAGDAAGIGRPAMRRLAWLVVAEAALGAAILGAVAVMSLTPPALHEQPTWPLAFRLTSAALVESPAGRLRALVGGQLAVLGAVAVVSSALARSLGTAVRAGGATLLALGLGLALPPLAIDAYPTTYRRPAVPYHATSIASGQALFQRHCAACHGRGGAGDGPAARSLPRPPADLTAPHTASHTAGDLFWWITSGIPRGRMPGFGGRLGEDERWDVINFLRALGSARGARAMGPGVTDERPWLVAPDFAFGVGPMPRALREYRGQRIVLLVLYSLPDSRLRLERLGERYGELAALGVEVIAVPTDGAPDALRRLGASTPIFYPVVTDGAADIAAAYGLFTSALHTELLIDRQGYVRARGPADGAARTGLEWVSAGARRLNAEPAAAAAPEIHVH